MFPFLKAYFAAFHRTTITVFIGNLSRIIVLTTIICPQDDDFHLSHLAARVVTDRISGYSKGFGFVRYATLEEAAQGIKGMDGQVSCNTADDVFFCSILNYIYQSIYQSSKYKCSLLNYIYQCCYMCMLLVYVSGNYFDA